MLTRTAVSVRRQIEIRGADGHARAHRKAAFPPLRWQRVHSVVDAQISADGAHVWPFNPSFPLDTRCFVFAKNRGIRTTRHEYFELLYVHSGHALYEVQGRQFEAKQGDLIVINGAKPHRVSKVLRAPFRVIVLYFLPSVLSTREASSGEDVHYLLPFLLDDETLPNLIPSEAGIRQEALELILKIQKELQVGDERAQLAARTYLLMIMVLLINYYKRRSADAFQRREKVLERMRPLFDFVEKHYPEPIALSTATSLIGMSKAHFMRSFKKMTGQSFDCYLNHLRIRKAQILLASSDKPIFDVSREVGFCDQSYFGLVFRRLVRITPREYRKRLSVI
jgi:AraC-like DNA-binding protein/mannose-6-phosphate isomerase-like protein (cupin superfamily)